MSFSRLNPADVAALKIEADTDPSGMGYAGKFGDTRAMLKLFNIARDVGSPLIQKPMISAAKIRGATTFDAYNTLSIDEQEWLVWMTGSDGFQEENIPTTADLVLQLTGAGNGLNSMWAAAHRVAMVSAMEAIVFRAASRAEILFGYGTQISSLDWAAARDS